jgi:hypothetical protein
MYPFGTRVFRSSAMSLFNLECIKRWRIETFSSRLSNSSREETVESTMNELIDLTGESKKDFISRLNQNIRTI